MVERLRERIKALEEENEMLMAEFIKNNTKIEVYNEVIAEMTAEQPSDAPDATEPNGYNFDTGM